MLLNLIYGRGGVHARPAMVKYSIGIDADKCAPLRAWIMSNDGHDFDLWA
jgi:hypothetical protein